jgi:hypothetical protein
MKDLPQHTEVPKSEGGILFVYCIIGDYAFHSQSFMGIKGQKLQYRLRLIAQSHLQRASSL